MNDVLFEELFNLSQSGMYFESVGDIEKSIEIYEKCVSMGWEGSHVYERLSIYYKKNKKYSDVDRVIKIYLEIYKNWYYRSNFHHTWKLENDNKYKTFKKRLDSIQKFL